jgi:drug/metabolite transporter (DMT)-like permease
MSAPKTKDGILISNNARGIISATMAALCWGSATVMSKFVIETINPILLLGIQLLVSVLVLWSIILYKNLFPIPIKNTWKIASLGVLEPWLAYLLGLIGLAKTEAIGATLIQSLEAILIVAIGAILYKSFPSKKFIILSLICFVGLLLSLGIFEYGEDESNSLIGMFLIFVGTAMAALYVVLSSRLANTANPIYIVAIQQTAGLFLACITVLFAWNSISRGMVIPVNLTTWLIIVISGLVQFALGFTLYIYALQSLSANSAGTFLNLTPVFGIACAFLVLGERMSYVQVAGAMLVILTVTLINRESK